MNSLCNCTRFELKKKVKEDNKVITIARKIRKHHTSGININKIESNTCLIISKLTDAVLSEDHIKLGVLFLVDICKQLNGSYFSQQISSWQVTGP